MVKWLYRRIRENLLSWLSYEPSAKGIMPFDFDRLKTEIEPGDILLVDPSYYLIGDRQELQIAYSEHAFFTTDQAAWRFTARLDGQPWIDNVITLENASTQVSPFVALAAA